MHATLFRKALLRWYDAHRRDLPWRDSRDFYRVWLSEVMLQQTRVEAVIPYYLRFLERFPSVEDLATAPEAAVLAAWSGLGYYSRARNLHRAAKQIVEAGIPSRYEGILALRGAGSYTASAVASIALGLPHAAVDGNVIRVISRLTNDASEISAPATRRSFASIAGELLDPKRPGDFNQAMMELGATVCIPRNPACRDCPVALFCAAHAAGTERELPVKAKKRQPRDVVLDLLVVRRGGRVLLVERQADEKRLAGFWELPERRFFPDIPCSKAGAFTHRIVDDRFHIEVWAGVMAVNSARLPDAKWFRAKDFEALPLTTVAKKALAIAHSH